MRTLIFFLLLGNFLSAQNLVVNPGFELTDTVYTPRRTNITLGMALPGWSAPTDGTPDSYYIRKEQMPKAPRPAKTIDRPFEGCGYVRFYSGISWEYLKGTLSEPLKEGTDYTVSVTIGADSPELAEENSVGIYFTFDPEFSDHGGGYKCLPVEPQILLKDAEVVGTRGGWTTYQTTYTAIGGECAFVIGCFEPTKKNGFYYADSVFIGQALEESTVEAEDTVMNVVVEPPAEITEEAGNDSLIAPGKTLTLANIYFETNKSRILPESYQPLYNIILEMKLQPNLKVEIVGHTDKHGDKTANQKLSEERAKAVADFFISKGIDASRITTRGCGSSQPVGDDDQKNRRVEFIFSE